MFPDEYTAFKTYCQLYPRSATLLVDTYNVLNRAFQTPYGPFRRFCFLRGSQIAPSGWTRET
jgi:nicotinate phosphoribosyltransferase